MNRWGNILFVSAIILLVGCTESANSLFATFVYPDTTIAKDILAKKVDCMHCPTYFRFETSSSGRNTILDYQRMQKVSKPTSNMENVLYLPKAKWWPSISEIDKMDKLWIEYPGNDSSEGPYFRMALINANTVYFMAKGGDWIRKKGQ